MQRRESKRGRDNGKGLTLRINSLVDEDISDNLTLIDQLIEHDTDVSVAHAKLL